MVVNCGYYIYYKTVLQYSSETVRLFDKREDSD